jgi:hypothetical protein
MWYLIIPVCIIPNFLKQFTVPEYDYADTGIDDYNIAHEYPSYKEVQIAELNLLPEEINRLVTIWKNLEIYSKQLLK